MLHDIPAPHASFPVFVGVLAVAAVVILASPLRRLAGRHLARLGVCLAVGAAAAFGVTAWADGQRHTALAAAARSHGHAVSVTGELASAFVVITVVTAAVAFAVSLFIARRRPSPSYRDYSQYAPPRRGW